MPWDPYFMAGDSVGLGFAPMNPKQKKENGNDTTTRGIPLNIHT